MNFLYVVEMDISASESEGLPLQPYQSDRSSVSAGRNALAIRLSPIRTLSPSSDIELRFLRVVGRNRVPIVQPADIRLDFPNSQNEFSTRNGFTMQVHRGWWGNQKVALKRIRRCLFDERDEQARADAARDHEQAMYDLNFELQIMSNKSLSKHRNISKLLAVSFDTIWETNGNPTNSFVLPVLIVELADERFPDLSLFLNAQHNPDLPKRLPFETSAALIADIADGVEALHNHDIVHADLKPENILIFPDPGAPCGFVAKVADYGFSGMATYLNSGKRAWHPDSRPRGGTTEWNAPECVPGLYVNSLGQQEEQPQDMSSRDIYSFGLLSSYIALDGQTPKSYIKNIQHVKLSDGMVEAVKMRLKEHYFHTLNDDRSLGNLAARIADMTLKLSHEKREKHIGGVRRLLFSR